MQGFAVRNNREAKANMYQTTVRLYRQYLECTSRHHRQANYQKIFQESTIKYAYKKYLIKYDHAG
jgi:hypothetical protein